jgi:hypothetical protein
MKRQWKLGMAIGVIMALITTQVILADNLVNDVTVGGTDTFTAPGSTIVGYKINTAAAGDPQSGCNANDGSPATVTISVPTGVTASATSLTFTACNVFQNVTFSSSTPGNYAIIVVSVSDTGTGSYNNQANFTLHVNAPPPPPNTAPGVSVTGVTHGASYEIGSVPAAGCLVVDAEDGNSTFAATLSAISGSLAEYGLGSQTASCSYTDQGGLSDSDSATYSIVDTTDPVITFVSRTAANGNGWNNGNVTVEWSCADSSSGVLAASVSQTVSTEGANQSATGTCEDHAGNTASDTQSAINIDKTAPSASASASPAANANGWNNTNVTVSFSGTDGLSGIDYCAAAEVLSSEGAGQSASGTCTDMAGNISSPAAVSGINIDKTAPNVSLVGGPANGGTYYFGFVPSAPTCSANDGLSGLDGFCSVGGYGTALGSHTVTASATDKAGNSASASATYTVLAWTLNGFYQPVDMSTPTTLVYNTVRNGSTVPLKFEVFAGSTELTDVANVKSLMYAQTSCDANATTDDIETLATGNTVLRYDTVAGQFVYNWKTPATAGKCYRVTMTTQDGSSLVAYFKLK